MGITITSNTGNTPAAGQTRTVLGQENAGTITITSIDSKSAIAVSALAQQLSEAAARAQTRDASLSRKDLGQKATALLSQITGDNYFANKAKNDAEVPGTSDPALLARARQATAFVNGQGSNPFKGLSRDQLDLIAYDDSGTFTVNERRAAWSEAYDQEEAWRRQVITQGELEYQATGKQNDFFAAVLKHYQGLPAIEQAQYPSSYASQLQEWIRLDFNFRTNRAEGTGVSRASLIEQWLAQGPHGNRASRTPETGAS
ncbi:hypothetical protein [Ralstonia pseudosolanacearum]|uniref:hypothetical protein n=1 Tax=Ralstonia pseudosolanacearum TaxID=1310165 RepID=UPI001FF9D430|nr:hypothetical protein [Ralstonia pseudosolanacearum]